MAIFNKEYLEEKYVSKYAEYLKDMPDEEDEDEEDDDIDEEDAKELEAYYKAKGKEVPGGSKSNKKNDSSSDKDDKKKEDSKKDEKDKDDDKDDKKESPKRSSLFASLQKAGAQASKPSFYNHLTKEEIRRAVSIVMTELKDFPKLKKCCDFVDLSDKEEINDDGEHESSFDKYYHSSPYSFIEIINGDTLSGYPDSRNDSEAFENDSRKFVKAVNDEFETKNIHAKFLTNPNRDDDVVSFGIKSTKGKSE